MCGIVGFFGEGDRDLLAAMNGAIAHRGPDDAGFLVDGPAGLAMRRLSIIDVGGGHQPIANETGRIHIVFNGELYNFRELKARHLGGHQFKTASDTEVVLHLYEELGEAAFAELNGMYAFALWDADRRALYLVRDRLGIKPLYYHQGQDRLAFASELKALLQDPAVGRRIDPDALRAYLTWQYVPGPETMLKGIRKLPAGHFMRVLEGQAPVIAPYWSLGPATGPASRPEDFLSVMRAAVRRQMVSDVPVGAFLSGGVDSSLVVALMAEVAPGLETFTAGFADPRLDESPWAERVARHLGVRHHVVRLDETALEELPHVVWHLDEPVADRAALPTYFLSRLAASRVKVVLTGEGSDELFAGYPRYRLEQLARRFHRLPLANQRRLWEALLPMVPGRARAKLAKLLLSPGDAGRRREAWVANFAPDRRATLLKPYLHAEVAPPQPDDAGLEAQLRLDLRTWLVDNVLMKCDKMTMAASLEARVPFLDHEVVDWAAALPAEAKLHGGEGKAVVKRAALSLLPREAVYRPKQAFHTPTATWFRAARGRALLTDVLLGDTARNRGLFEMDAVEALIREHQAGADRDQALWNLLVLELWLRAYLDPAPIHAGV
jgi:asparagine synthase (glutamine-hydrolysing)